jgi:hypothetical protein
MKQELQDQLYAKYPDIFGDRTKPMTETAMCWGIECGDGWYDIINTLCALIQWKVNSSKKTVELCETWLKEENLNENLKHQYTLMLESAKSNEVNQVRAVQVKEKFGTLRFYTNSVSPEIDAYINFAENMSAITCDVCGNKGKINEGGWLKVRCEQHEEE